MSNEHWDTIFKNTSHENLGWYEQEFSQSLKYINLIPNLNDKVIFIPGAGTTKLVDELLNKAKKLILNDISAEAISILKNRFKNTKQNIEYLISDISENISSDIDTVDLWIDRAVLHFLTDESQISGYFKNLRNNINIGGHVLFAEFSDDGAEKCAGLDLHRYSLRELKDRCSDNFELVSHHYYTFINPGGEDRPYIYGLFKRV